MNDLRLEKVRDASPEPNLDESQKLGPSCPGNEGDTLDAQMHHRRQVLEEIGDPLLTRFVNSHAAHERDDIMLLASAIRMEEGPLHRYEAILMALKFFHNNESVGT
jgi:hypothetical protein